MKRGVALVLVATGLISAVTAMTREGLVPLGVLAATPDSVGDGRVWLLATSALVADKPAVASILGFAVVGLATLVLCGPRIAWTAAVAGHVCSAALVYAGVELAHDRGALAYPDYGTSAIIAAWVGASACAIWLGGRRAAAVALCVASALLGWACKGSLTVLDWEHALALGIGAGLVLWRPSLASVVDRPRQVMRSMRLVERHPEPRVDLRDDHLQLGRP
jgi:hypothetical protein